MNQTATEGQIENCTMAVEIDFKGLWEFGTMERFESTLRGCIGNPPENEEWSILVTSYGCYCVVLAKAPEHTCRKIFGLRSLEFIDAIPAWLEQRPLESKL
jgi:hypothetical protein